MRVNRTTRLRPSCPRSNPTGFSINVRCLDPGTIEAVRVSHFDGRNWELHAEELAHLSIED